MGHVIKIQGYDYNPAEPGGWVVYDAPCELNEDKMLSGFSLPISVRMYNHMTSKYRDFLQQVFKDKAGEQTVHFTFGKEALMFLLSQEDCNGITFCLGINDNPANGAPPEHVTLIACGVTERKIGGVKQTDSKERVIIDPIKKEAFEGKLQPGETPPPLYEVIPPTTLAEVLAQEQTENLKTPSYTSFL